MKAIAVNAVSVLLGITLLPVLLAGGDPPPAIVCGINAGPMEVILATIRQLESGGNYEARAAGSTASGAYQFLDPTWDNYDGYPRAADAPVGIQDAKAAEIVNVILEQHHNDVSAVPVVWYIGHVPADDATELDTVPAPRAGNVLTPRHYQARWLDTYHSLLDATDDTTVNDVEEGDPQPGSCFGRSIEPLPGGWSLPGPRQLIDANPAALAYPHHDYPAWDWAIPTNTPIYAMRAGTVSATRTWSHNWWEAGCTTNTSGCDTCGIGLTITESQGTRWTYCHGNNLTVTIGADVEAGQQIMWSGNTGRSSGPHLHLEIRTPDGRQRCPQSLLAALHSGGPSIDTSSLPAMGCSYQTGTISLGVGPACCFQEPH